MDVKAWESNQRFNDVSLIATCGVMHQGFTILVSNQMVGPGTDQFHHDDPWCDGIVGSTAHEFHHRQNAIFIGHIGIGSLIERATDAAHVMLFYGFMKCLIGRGVLNNSVLKGAHASSPSASSMALFSNAWT